MALSLAQRLHVMGFACAELEKNFIAEPNVLAENQPTIKSIPSRRAFW
jgi:hypothetical protein